MIIPVSGINQEALSDWTTRRESDLVKISDRIIRVGDTLVTREMRLSFTLDATPEKIVAMFKEADKLTRWSAGARSCEILLDVNVRWLTYSTFDFPWPFRQADLITEYRITRMNSLIQLSYKSGFSNQLNTIGNYSTQQKYEGLWLFLPNENRTTEVEFRSYALFNSVI